MYNSLLVPLPEDAYLVSGPVTGVCSGGFGGDGDEEPARFKVSVDVKTSEMEESLTQVMDSSMKIQKGMEVGLGEMGDEEVRSYLKMCNSRSMIRKDMVLDFEEYFPQVVLTSFKMSKRVKDNSLFAPIELEESVAQAFFDLQHTNRDLKDDLKDLYIDSATQVNVSANCKAILIRYPYKLHEGFRKIHGKLVRQLEKKFRGNVVILIGRGRPVQPSRFCFPVLCDNLLSDIVYPAEIMYKSNVSKCGKYYLNPKARNDTEDRLEAFAGVYKKLCWRDVEFRYM